jgi:hypothetical protein
MQNSGLSLLFPKNSPTICKIKIYLIIFRIKIIFSINSLINTSIFVRKFLYLIFKNNFLVHNTKLNYYIN